MKSYKTVEAYIEGHSQWAGALNKLRKIMLASEMQETVKWGAPVYTVGGKNVVGLAAFSNYVGIWFHQGVFLKDPAKVLINAQEGKTKALRQWRFADADEIDADLVAAYVAEAIQNQKAGKEIKPQKKALVIPDELDSALANNSNLKACFEALGRSKQREFAEYIAEAKRADTKTKRLEKIIPMILDGIGLNDKYR